jgi:DNA-binding PadR family transcriptional regulator
MTAPARTEQQLSLTEHIVLALVGEAPAHGFALARLVDSDHLLGQTFRIPRPVVYRALDRLLAAGLIEVDGVQASSQGPQRTRYRITRAGRRAVQSWLNSPVLHIRDVRTEFLIKLVLLERAGSDAVDLIDAQRAVVEPIVTALERRADNGPDRVINSWRYESAQATLRFLDKISLG